MNFRFRSVHSLRHLQRISASRRQFSHRIHAHPHTKVTKTQQLSVIMHTAQAKHPKHLHGVPSQHHDVPRLNFDKKHRKKNKKFYKIINKFRRIFYLFFFFTVIFPTLNLFCFVFSRLDKSERWVKKKSPLSIIRLHVGKVGSQLDKTVRSAYYR